MPHGLEVTQHLLDYESGDKSALDKLTPVVYSELRRLAGAYLSRQSPDQTLQPTALVHEAYLRLAEQSRLGWRNRAHFFGIAAQCMRQILVDHARSRHAAKRGGGWHRLSLEDVVVVSEQRSSEVLDLDAAL